MTNRNHHLTLLALLSLLLIMGGIAIGASWQRTGDSIPRCAEDDFNSTGIETCYVIDVDGKVIVLDSGDEVIS